MNKYKPSKTALKAAPPLIILFLLQSLRAALDAANVTISDEAIYNCALVLYSAFIGLVNYLKNRKRQSDQEDAETIEKKPKGKDPML